MKNKTCKGCLMFLDIKHFSKSKNVKDGYENKCKHCRNKQRMKYTNICKVCESSFKTSKKQTMYCSSECQGFDRRVRVTVHCDYCYREKEILKSRLRNNNHFCDQSCRNEFMKMTLQRDNNPNFSSRKTNCSGCYVTIYVNEHRTRNHKHYFCSYQCYKDNIGRYYTGKNNNFYNHDLTKEERLHTRRYKGYYNWRDSVYKRDEYTCQCCGDDKGGNLIAHHIYNYSEHKDKRTNINNGITLCNVCHKDFHCRYGYRNNNKQQLDEFIYSYNKTPIP